MFTHTHGPNLQCTHSAPHDGASAIAMSWQAIWRKLAHYGYVHVTYGTYLTRDGRVIQIADWDVAVPKILRRLSRNWGYSPWNPEFRSGLIQFERADHLIRPGDQCRGRLTARVRRALRGNIPFNPYPFQWVEVEKWPHPEQLRIWRDRLVSGQQFSYHGRWIFRSIVNTGVLHTTPDGTWPIYQRLPSTTMIGTYPVTVDTQEYRQLAPKMRAVVAGRYVYWQHYIAHNVRYVNYFYDGRAIHFYPRKGYGWPQSAGCVEEPLAEAKKVYGLLNYGDLVSVVGHYRITATTGHSLTRRTLLAMIQKSIANTA